MLAHMTAVYVIITLATWQHLMPILDAQCHSKGQKLTRVAENPATHFHIIFY